jgi:hypothetical protein
MKLRFFILNFGGALAIRLQDPFVRSRVFAVERAQQLGVSYERQMKRPAAKEAGGTGS